MILPINMLHMHNIGWNLLKLLFVLQTRSHQGLVHVRLLSIILMQ